jgi:hypothetical protein
VVTGAASGIGRAVCEELARHGCRLALVDIDTKGLAETEALVTRAGAETASFVADVSDRTRMEQLPAEVHAAFGAIHILVNNAGVSVGATFSEQSLEDFEWILGINLRGVVYGCKFFIPYLEREDEAHIVNVSSMFAFLGLPGQSTYSITKAGVYALSEALWTELAHTRIGVTSVHPGGIRTNIIRSARITDAEGQAKGIELIDRYGHSAEKAARKIVQAIRSGRKRLLIGPEAYVLGWVKRLLPVTTHRVLTAIYLRSPATRRSWEREAAARPESGE